jgi:transposase
LSTKIRAMVDALGNPLAFFLTAGQAHDLQGADVLLPQMQADTLLADKAFDADERVIEPLLAAGQEKSVSFRPRVIERFNVSSTRNCTRRATSWRTSIVSSSSTEPLRPAMTRPPETSSLASIWPLLSFGLIEDRL